MAGTAPYGDDGFEHLVEDGLAMRTRTVLDLTAPAGTTPGAAADGAPPLRALEVPAHLAAMAAELDGLG